MKTVNIHQRNISVSRQHAVYFSHMTDIPAPTSHPFHLHDYTEVIVCVSGNVDCILGGKYYSLSPMDVVVAQANELHKMIIKTEEPYERFYIGFPAGCFSFMDRAPDPLAGLEKRRGVYSFPKPTADRLLARLRRMAEYLEQDGEGYALPIFTETLRLLQLLDSAMGEEAGTWDDGAMVRPHTVETALRLLEQHLSDMNSVKELADRCGVTSAYLSDLFSKSMKVPLKQYMTAKKIAMAKERLAAGDDVTTTAFACGFCTVSHFIAVFRRVTGMTPNAYRKGMDT